MKKSELIAALEQYPNDAEIVLIFDTCRWGLNDVFDLSKYEPEKGWNMEWDKGIGVIHPDDPAYKLFRE